MTTPPEHDSLQAVRNVWQGESVATKYARAEKATKPYADIMIKKAGFASLKGNAHVLDLACGTGAVTASLYNALPRERWNNVKVLGGDLSESMLAYLKNRGEKEGWTGLETKVVDATNLQLPPNTFTHLTINFAIFALPSTVLPSCFSLLQPGGFIGISSWARFTFYPLLAKAVSRLPNPPPIPSYDEIQSRMHSDRPWSEPAYVRKVLEEAGFVDVEVVEEHHRIDGGTPAQFVETMSIPIQSIAGAWEESTRGEIVNAVLEELRKYAVEEVGGEDKHFFMDMEGIVGTGRKPPA